jgi:hypothetical protein
MSRDLFTVAVSTARADKTRFASCPGPLDAKQAVLHGLSLRPAQPGRYTLYATNHGGRESVEVFEVDARGAAPSAVWIGCVMMPDKLAANSVAAFPARNSCLKSAAPPRLRPPQVYIMKSVFSRAPRRTMQKSETRSGKPRRLAKNLLC